MMRKVKVEDPGDTVLLTGALIDALEFERINEQAEAEGKTRQRAQIFSGKQRHPLQQIHFCPPHPSRKPQGFLQMLR
jgi:hypothetical protein